MMRPLSVVMLICLGLLTACSTTGVLRKEADSLAASAGMHPAEVKAGPYTLLMYERMAGVSAPVHVYIEDDGNGWRPTPRDPVALRLAMRDNALNVVYMARVCQYIMTDACRSQDWTSARYGDAIITDYDEALRRYNGHPLELIGYSGGAAVALLLAARRDDVISVRTVAGTIDTDAFARLHHLSPLSGSMNPASVMGRTDKIPQRHFVGAEDDVVPEALVRAYQERLPVGHCSAYNVVPGLDHDSGWADVWPVLLAQPLPCTGGGADR